MGLPRGSFIKNLLLYVQGAFDYKEGFQLTGLDFPSTTPEFNAFQMNKVVEIPDFVVNMLGEKILNSTLDLPDGTSETLKRLYQNNNGSNQIIQDQFDNFGVRINIDGNDLKATFDYIQTDDVIIPSAGGHDQINKDDN